MQTLITLEEQGWQALSTPGEAGRQFYADMLRQDAVMVFPGGMRLDGKDAILASLAATPWQSYEIESPQVLTVTPTVSVVDYKVTARRDGSEPYTAHISSTYVRDAGRWQLVFHQQTAV